MSKRRISARRAVLAVAIGAIIIALSPAAFAQVTPADLRGRLHTNFTCISHRDAHEGSG